MGDSISELELTALNELISIANEFSSEEYKNKAASDNNLKEQYKKAKPTVTYTTGPADSDGHCRSAIELKYVRPEEEITIWFMDRKFYLASIPNNFNERIKAKLGIKK
ncbi:MAG: hypothetical protein ACP5NZ_04780 [Nanobdellota archaeon]